MNAKKKVELTALALGAGALLVLGWSLGRSARAEAPRPAAQADLHDHPHPTAARAPARPAARPAASAPVIAADAPLVEATPGVLPPPVLHPRAPEEWQGMKVDLSLQPPCLEALHCGQAMACDLAAHRCGPCAADADCGAGEACVLDHCVLDSNVACRRRSDCGEDALCVLSGLSPGARGNAEMRAYCQSNTDGEREETPPGEDQATARVPASAPEHPEVYGGRLLDALRAEQEGVP